ASAGGCWPRTWASRRPRRRAWHSGVGSPASATRQGSVLLRGLVLARRERNTVGAGGGPFEEAGHVLHLGTQQVAEQLLLAAAGGGVALRHVADGAMVLAQGHDV